MRVESLLLAVTQVTTSREATQLSTATGFFFGRDAQLFLVTTRHVLNDEATGHYPDRLEIDLHVDRENAAAIVPFSLPLYGDGRPLWRQGTDAGGPVDVAVMPLDRAALPVTARLAEFTPAHLVRQLDEIEVGTSVLVVGFPLGFHDTLHHLPVARQAVVASAFGIRFQGNGYFLTDARTHRGMSGAPVVTRVAGQPSDRGDLTWRLLGIHGARLDMGNRDLQQDEGLALNCAWYADILLTLTQEPAPRKP